MCIHDRYKYSQKKLKQKSDINIEYKPGSTYSAYDIQIKHEIVLHNTSLAG